MEYLDLYALIFGRIINNVDDKSRSSDYDISNCFYNELGSISLAYKIVFYN